MTITVREIQSKTLLRKMKRVDSWFIAAYTMNLYRGCAHNCAYCDGRAEKYQVAGDFGSEVAVKINAVELLQKELDPARKRTPFKKGYICLGGGVGDSYQPIEKEIGLTRRVLEFLAQLDTAFPVHILTKSDLVLRDLDLLKKMNKRSKVMVSFSLSSAHDGISQQFEPGASTPSQRLAALKRLKQEGIASGVFLLPVIPFITDTREAITYTLERLRRSGIDYLLFGGMTMKEGRQKEFFFDLIRRHYPHLLHLYEGLYSGDPWGNASQEYYSSLQQAFNLLIQQVHIPQRIPPRLYTNLLAENDRVCVMLEHIDYFIKAQGQKSPYGYAAYSISKLNEPLSSMKFSLSRIKGVGRAVERVILEILERGTSSYLERLLH